MQHRRFFFNLGLVGAAVLLIVASVAFGPNAVKGIGLGIGSASVVMSLWFIAVSIHQRPLEGHRELEAFGHRIGLWSMLAAASGAVAAWEVVQVTVFAPTPAKWLTLANGLVVGTLGCAGLVAHEVSSERVVHCLEVVERHES